MYCEACFEPVRACACCAGEVDRCTCGIPICDRCAEALCVELDVQEGEVLGHVEAVAAVGAAGGR